MLKQKSLPATRAPSRSFVSVLWALFAPAPTTVSSPEHCKSEDTGPRDAVLLIDASPSMTEQDWPPDRLTAAKRAAITFVNRLAAEEPRARVAVVAYAGTARIQCGLTAVSHAAVIR